ncbi:hypothetical protein CERSUDRAFT_106768 [Gelatoporia subvermispora B]|uniref:F-box domain-containing protein n=1 Tax=Ceriporiopsis subvermispora (strain B) TaxID=914234 RepID=M2PH71_CERS8|nr:hypothetical protein CERSUDRAFT_106768 [Gelatoporia subvermispora B]
MDRPAHPSWILGPSPSLSGGSSQQSNSEVASTTFRIPYELCDSIIDLLREDRRALCACSLVHRAWLPKARYWLYKHVRINSTNKAKFQVVLTSNAALGDNIERLTIFARFPHHPFEWDKFLQSVTPHMPRLTRLEIHAGYLKDPKSFQYLTTIRTLQLKGTCIESEATRLAWLRSIPQVEELKFWKIRLIGSSPIAASDYPLLFNLKSVKVHGARSGASNFLNYISPDVIRRIQRFDYGHLARQPFLDSWFHNIAATLEHLAFTSTWYSGNPSDQVLIHCTRLRSLEYSMGWNPDSEKSTAGILWTLRTVASPSLTVLRFNLLVDDRRVYDHKLSISDRPALLAMLLSPKFASLERLSFHLSIIDFRMDGCEPPLLADLRALLPDLNTRGILALSSEPAPKLAAPKGPTMVLETEESSPGKE